MRFVQFLFFRHALVCSFLFIIIICRIRHIVKMIPNTFSYNHKLPDFYIAYFKQQMDMVCHQTIRIGFLLTPLCMMW